ncbi:UNKNOWN [Stylonychia lemnae]|uniref:Uncharacterized protein n=1 Tax=Stylonychia lemnae TaxID=5949 RepID=A0A078AWL9_STYLE|nr:UNKNOWN [Stylonychia lemnae]|eukprot:CDW85203.1 UNKNOWN [Stylonychia lemnae]
MLIPSEEQTTLEVNISDTKQNHSPQYTSKFNIQIKKVKTFKSHKKEKQPKKKLEILSDILSRTDQDYQSKEDQKDEEYYMSENESPKTRNLLSKKKSKVELLKDMTEYNFAPWDQDSPRRFIHIMGSTQKANQSNIKTLQGSPIKDVKQSPTKEFGIRIQPSISPAKSPTRAEKRENQLESVEKKLHSSQKRLKTASPETRRLLQSSLQQQRPSSPLKINLVSIENQSKCKHQSVLRLKQVYSQNKVKQTRLRDLHYQGASTTDLPSQIQNNQLGQLQFQSLGSLSNPQIMKNQHSEFLNTRRESPRDQQILFKQANDLRQKILAKLIKERMGVSKFPREPLELSGKQFQSFQQKLNQQQENNPAQSQCTDNKENEQTHDDSDQTEKTQDQMLKQVHEICRKGVLQLNPNQSVLRKTIQRYYKNQEKLKNDDLIKMVQDKRDLELQSLAITQGELSPMCITNFNDDMRSNSSRRVIQQPGFNQIIKKNNSHALLIKQRQGQKVNYRDIDRKLLLESKEFKQSANTQRIFIQQRRSEIESQSQIRQTQSRMLQERNTSLNAKKKFMQILDEIKMKLENGSGTELKQAQNQEFDQDHQMQKNHSLVLPMLNNKKIRQKV